MFKFDLEQVVWYVEGGIPHSATIQSRMCVENAHDDWVCTREQEDLYQKFGVSIVKYRTVHGIYAEDKLFDSRLALMKSFA